MEGMNYSTPPPLLPPPPTTTTPPTPPPITTPAPPPPTTTTPAPPPPTTTTPPPPPPPTTTTTPTPPPITTPAPSAPPTTTTPAPAPALTTTPTPPPITTAAAAAPPPPSPAAAAAPPLPPPAAEAPTPLTIQKLLTNERVHEILKKSAPIPLDQLPPNLCPLSRFYSGDKIGLPNGWLIEQRPRTTPEYVGKVDQFYYEPETGKQFRSLRAVLVYLEVKASMERAIAGQAGDQPNQQFGHDQSKNGSAAESSSAQQASSSTPWKMKKKKKRRITSTAFDFANAPESITWALTNAENNEWSAFHGDETGVPNDLKIHWNQIFMISIKNYQNHAPIP
ncbi:hypothetical protein JCGZ_09081 [Jatropha curcas]|uniref:MBD domain-containing protein n=1 Tax=Jatropha curcas TaxID=180498 RepID=A0A067KKX0_JATCU|nr:hypothetical protein JCGZ_09081 [Jatropha curcas]